MHQIRKFFYYIVPLLLVLILPVLIINNQKVRQLLSKASGTKANISINVTNSLGPITPFWNSFAQGGEESGDMIAPVVGEIAKLQPQHVRIDHIYDHFNLVSKNSMGQILLNFTDLDKIVGSIRKTGATPLLSLSYMPSSIAVNGDITEKPQNWDDWSYVVRATVEHYSGRNNLNIKDIYYEVWNDPDLFGNWKTYGDKNYLTLYDYAVKGAQTATNTLPFKIGGPATTNLYKNWILDLSKYVTDNNLRIDFFSWHFYSQKTNDIPQMVSDLNNWLKSYPRLAFIPKIITEWGINSETDASYDESISAAHSVAVVRNAFYGINKLFAFELVDGLSPHDKKFWGRWGLLTHPKFSISQKPRFQAFLWLNQIQGNWLRVIGEGTYVQALACQKENITRLLLTNYDPAKSNTEDVPISLTNLENGQYLFKIDRLDKSLVSKTITVSDHKFTTNIIMPPNSLVFLELTLQK